MQDPTPVIKFWRAVVAWSYQKDLGSQQAREGSFFNDPTERHTCAAHAFLAAQSPAGKCVSPRDSCAEAKSRQELYGSRGSSPGCKILSLLHAGTF